MILDFLIVGVVGVAVPDELRLRYNLPPVALASPSDSVFVFPPTPEDEAEPVVSG